MTFREHLELRDKHAFLSPSSYSWLRYDPEKLRSVYRNQLKKAEGTRLHAVAKELIELGIMLPEVNETLNMYVNDCIICRLKPEQPLFYSKNCYGTSDAIGYDGTLRIFDFKSGETKACMDQLKIYAALFFLEYSLELDAKPEDTDIELRIYQSRNVTVECPHGSEIREIMNTIIAFDQLLNEIEWGDRYGATSP